MARLLATILLLLTALALPGCLAADDNRVPPPLETVDVPDAYQASRLYEEHGLKELRTGNRFRDKRRRREHLDQAMLYFREARELYVQELIHDPGEPDKQLYLNSEIDRLSDMIDHVHALRPAADS